MSCERFREQIPECLAGRLDPGARERLIAHLETCSGCRGEVAELNAVWRGLEAMPVPEPDPAMKTRFLEVLEAYQAGLEQARVTRGAGFPGRFLAWWPTRLAWQAALSAALVIAGGLGGRYLAGPRATPGPDVAQLRAQVENLRQLVTLSMLQEPSPSARLRGVTYSQEITRPDEQVEQALLHAVNHDSNVNVRLSAVDALQKYAANPAVRQALVDAIPVQESALVQVALIDTLVQLNAKEAAPALRKIAHDKDANEAVRQRAASACQRLEVTQ